MNIYQKLLDELNAGAKAVMVTELEKVPAEYSGNNQGYCKKEYFTEDCLQQSGLYPSMQQSLLNGELQIIESPEGKIAIIEPFFPQPCLYVFGGGHIAKPLTEMAAKLGFSVTVVDDRLSFANKERFPDAARVICESFDRCFELLSFNAYTYVVIVTRGHRHDAQCLKAVAQRKWAYAGMIGSRRRVKSLKEQLLSEGCPREVLEKVNAPIGLEIGAITPQEIALSILAQVVSYRRLENPGMGRESAKISWTEFDRDVLEEISRGKNERRAIVTVISAKGSVPRKAGAKMLVWPDGKILGSIGGGCSEGAVIQTAIDIALNGGYKIQNIDLTGTIAEDEGMVCGGKMQVLIESLS
ncbi:MAG: xanthine dehydrogenase [Dehalobacter sp. 4CP]|uniref:XdhC family protein n=1 Tax=Dehalobacter sp. CP TaxID=2594474 RepID=UPI0013C6D3B6|nr:XdhC family protein [Dehalobacter sp.]NBJ15934.1 xanthine dehydrogenase [Dehalobacter sp. 4CP]